MVGGLAIQTSKKIRAVDQQGITRLRMWTISETGFVVLTTMTTMPSSDVVLSERLLVLISTLPPEFFPDTTSLRRTSFMGKTGGVEIW